MAKYVAKLNRLTSTIKIKFCKHQSCWSEFAVMKFHDTASTLYLPSKQSQNNRRKE